MSDERKVAKGAKASSASAVSRKKKPAASLDEEGVPVGGGVGQLVVEKKTKKKRKSKADESGGDTDEEDGGGKHKAKKARGASSVDASKGNLNPQELRHEEYMKLKVDELKLILNTNLISLPKPANKDHLAWQCVYGEVMGAPGKLCPRCGKGKLKPKLKKQEFGVVQVKKGETKWTCPGYFDDEADALAFCNKAFTDADLRPVKFKGIGQITDADIDAVAERKAKWREEHAAAALQRSLSGISDSSELDEHGKPKKKFIHAPSIRPEDKDKEAKRKAKKQKAKGSDDEDEDEVEHATTEEEGSEDEEMHSVEDDARAAAEAVAAAAADPSLAGFASDAPEPAAPAAAPAAAAATSAAAAAKPSAKPPCKYGASCYRTSAEHLDSFSHPPLK